MRLDAVTAEYQLAKIEHQSDMDSLKQELADVRKRSQSRERTDRESIDELTRQNEKLTEQLLNVSIKLFIIHLIVFFVFILAYLAGIVL